MPGSRVYTFEDKFRVWITGDLEDRRTVYFTDQFPVFTVHVENLTEHKLVHDLRIAFSYQRTPDDRHEYERYEPEIAPGATEHIAFKPDMLPYQGPAVIGFWHPGYEEVTEEDEGGLEVQTAAGQKELTPLYTFMVYDREFYTVNYFRTRRAQYMSAALAALIIAVGVLQVILTMLIIAVSVL